MRPRLFGIAHRILGGVAEAEDVVQDTWIRWHGTDRRGVRNAAAFLATATTRLAINVVDSARARHEAPGGGWLPEPIDLTADPTVGVERDEAVELAVRTLMEKLSPTERAVFVLREAFDYPYRRDRGGPRALRGQRPATPRPRARPALGERRLPVSGGEHRRLLAAFTTASQTGEVAPLEQLLAGEAVASPARCRGVALGPTTAR